MCRDLIWHFAENGPPLRSDDSCAGKGHLPKDVGDRYTWEQVLVDAGRCMCGERGEVKHAESSRKKIDTHWNSTHRSEVRFTPVE